MNGKGRAGGELHLKGLKQGFPLAEPQLPETHRKVARCITAVSSKAKVTDPTQLAPIARLSEINSKQLGELGR